MFQTSQKPSSRLVKFAGTLVVVRKIQIVAKTMQHDVLRHLNDHAWLNVSNRTSIGLCSLRDDELGRMLVYPATCMDLDDNLGGDVNLTSYLDLMRACITNGPGGKYQYEWMAER